MIQCLVESILEEFFYAWMSHDKWVQTKYIAHQQDTRKIAICGWNLLTLSKHLMQVQFERHSRALNWTRHNSPKTINSTAIAFIPEEDYEVKERKV